MFRRLDKFDWPLFEGVVGGVVYIQGGLCSGWKLGDKFGGAYIQWVYIRRGVLTKFYSIININFFNDDPYIQKD